MRFVKASLLSLLVALLCVLGGPAHAADASKPNIIFILPDDAQTGLKSQDTMTGDTLARTKGEKAKDIR